MHDDRLAPCEADLARLGYGPPRQPRPVPAKVVAVVLRFDDGREEVFPCDRPTRLTGPPKRVEIISGRAFVRDW